MLFCLGLFFSLIELTLAIVSCPAGKYGNATTCELCNPGYYSQGGVVTTCLACPAGTYSTQIGGSSCTDCPIGSYAGSAAVTNCKLCPTSSYGDAPKLTACRSCAGGLSMWAQRRGATSKTDCSCRKGYYWDSSISDCIDCPKGANCTGGMNIPIPTLGYWTPVVGNTTYFVSCEWSPYACEGLKCRDNHLGRLCADCLIGHAWKLGGRCYDCGYNARVYQGLVLSGFLVLMVTVLMLSRQGANASMMSLIQHLQIISTISTFGGKWPREVEVALATISVMNLNMQVLQLNCYFQNQGSDFDADFMEIAVFFGIPSLLLFITCVYGAGVHALRQIQLRLYGSTTIPKQLIFKSLTGVLGVGAFLYMPVFQRTMSLAFCMIDGAGSYELLNPKITCYDTTWKKYIFPLILCGFGQIFFIPIGFSAMLWYCRKIRDDPIFRDNFAFFWRVYKPQFYWWELVFYLRKFSLVIFSVMLRGYPIYQSSVLLCYWVGFMLLHFYLHPFIFHGSNLLDDTLYVGTLSILFISILYRASDDLANTASFQLTFSLIALMIETLTLTVAFVFAWFEIRQVLRLKRLSSQAQNYAIKVANDPRDLMRFTWSLVYQKQLSPTFIHWLTHTAKTKEKQMLTEFYQDVSPMVNADAEGVELTSFKDLDILGNSIAKIVRVLATIEPRERKVIKKFMQNLHVGRFKSYFFDGTDPWIVSDWLLNSNDIDLVDGFKELMGSIQSWHLKEEFAHTLLKVPLFKDTEKTFIDALVLEMMNMSVQAGQFICRKGSVGNEMYFINRGSLNVKNGNMVVATLHEGQFFGEISMLFEGQPRTADVEAESFCDLYVLTKKSLDSVTERFPKVKAKLSEYAEQRKTEMDQKQQQQQQKEDDEREQREREAHENGEDESTCKEGSVCEDEAHKKKLRSPAALLMMTRRASTSPLSVASVSP